jgi:hypothetical protein
MPAELPDPKDHVTRVGPVEAPPGFFYALFDAAVGELQQWKVPAKCMAPRAGRHRVEIREPAYESRAEMSLAAVVQHATFVAKNGRL